MLSTKVLRGVPYMTGTVAAKQRPLTNWAKNVSHCPSVIQPAGAYVPLIATVDNAVRGCAPVLEQ
jgi:hypothetical protein